MRTLPCVVVLVACSSSPHSPAAPPASPVAAESPAASAAAAQPGPAPAPAAAKVLVAQGDMPANDLDGNSFALPDGWKLETFAAMVVLTPPEGDSHIAIVDVSADSADAARDAVWKAYRPGAPPPPVLSTEDVPARDGWSRGKNYVYQVSPNEKRRVIAGVRFAGGRWCAIVFDFASATGEKRGGQIEMVFERLLPRGHDVESFKGRTAARLDAGKLEQLAKFVRDGAQVTGTPGVAFGVIQNGDRVWAGGIGVRELGKPATVDDKTLFMIASNTKSLTTLMLAKLVDDGKLTWDEPVTRVLPGFQLGNAEVTRQVQIKHLICACTGLPRQDLEWLFEWGNATPDTVMKTLATMVPTSKFGELFQYSNLMAAAGGFVGGHAMYPRLALGPAYDRAMQTLVFDPLGMASTTFDYGRALRGNHAMPHAPDIDGRPARVRMEENFSIIPARPAGAAWSNVDDLLRYLEMELAEGKLPDGKPYIARSALLARREPGVAIGADGAYGMGLIIHDKYDVTVYHHGGDLFGFHSDMMWIPAARTGAVVLTNGDLGYLIRNEFRRKLLELLYGGKPEADEDLAISAQNAMAEIAAARKLLTVPADRAAVERLARAYRNPVLGDILVRRDARRTTFDFGEFASEVATRTNPDGTTTFQTIDPGLDRFGFVVGEAGGKPTLTLRDGQHEYVFEAK